VIAEQEMLGSWKELVKVRAAQKAEAGGLSIAN